MKAIVPILIAALFVVGCASTQQTYQLATVEVGADNFYRHKDTNKPVTGRVVAYYNGQLYNEIFVKEGLKHGPFRTWHGRVNQVIRTDFRNHDSVFENGKLVRHKRFWFEPLASRGASTANGFQMTVGGWNQDGTPAEQGKGKGIKK